MAVTYRRKRHLQIKGREQAVRDEAGIDLTQETPAILELAPLPAEAEATLPAGSPTGRAWETVKLARHPRRPHTLDYIKGLFGDFFELKGDRRFGEDAALAGGIAAFGGRKVLALGHQKGRDTRENLARNFGMPRPEGYRKALRLFRLAEKFHMPVICFIDTPGAYPGLESEERGVAQAIAENLLVLAELRVPVIAIVAGEGGSGGALAIGLADRVLMLENAIYSVASPEAAASILWRDAALAPEAAAAMKITSAELRELGLVDEIIPEPAGGAHTDEKAMYGLLRPVLLRVLAELETIIGPDRGGLETLLEQRYQKYRAMGAWRQAIAGY